jgi:hypothetical protein
MVQLLKDPRLREQVGSRAKESVRQNFLMSRLWRIGSTCCPNTNGRWSDRLDSRGRPSMVENRCELPR